MLIRVGFNMVCNFPLATPAILMLYIHPSRSHTIKKQDCIITDPQVELKDYIDSFGNRCARMKIPQGRLVIKNDALVLDNGLPNFIDHEAKQHEIDELPSECLQFLLASRYCEVDLIGDIAWNLFGTITNSHEKVMAIADWVHNNIRFDYQQASKTRTALDTYKERVGVCRDFSHLAIAMFRALHIPARYATGYLGDIGIEPLPFPMDFSSWAEVYLGNKWYVVDPRHNIPRIGHVPIAYGRDASDVAIITTFGQNFLEKFEVWTYEIADINKQN